MENKEKIKEGIFKIRKAFESLDIDTLFLMRKAIAHYLDVLDEEMRKYIENDEYLELEKTYNVLCDLTFDK